MDRTDRWHLSADPGRHWNRDMDLRRVHVGMGRPRDAPGAAQIEKCRWSPPQRQAPAPPKSAGPPGLDVNAVLSYNVKAIRERRGMTQQQVAERLAQLTRHQLPQALISAMERGFEGERRRRFDAHELYLLSVVFDVPIAYFFIPPPGTGMGELADTRRPIAELWRSLLGTGDQLDAIDAGSTRSRSRTPTKPTSSSQPSLAPNRRSGTGR
jgi:transcriptional regulator with XRE-family HTH domain